MLSNGKEIIDFLNDCEKEGFMVRCLSVKNFEITEIDFFE